MSTDARNRGSRLLFVHAHPDDETINNGATIAHYAARGADVHVVTCTLGEEGEVIGERWEMLAASHADQLGGFRIGELCAALRLLGVGDPIFLGGAGRWRDSGMAGTQPVSRTQPFVDSGAEAVDALAASSGTCARMWSSPTTPTADTGIPTTSVRTRSPPPP